MSRVLVSAFLLAACSSSSDATVDGSDGGPGTPAPVCSTTPCEPGTELPPGAVVLPDGGIVTTDEPVLPPTSLDGLQNADESDVDCGGVETSAPKCTVGKKCNGASDCTTDACLRDGPSKGTCAESPSCGTHYGGQTCGAGEVGAAGAKHESCCKSLPVASTFADRLHPGKRVYLDKYEITAGRMREFLTRMEEQYGGAARVQTWIKEHLPPFWNDSADAAKNWTRWLPEGKSTEVTLPRFNMYRPPGDPVVAEPIYGDVGSDYILGPNGWYFYTHGHNCDASAYPTYWYPEDVWKNKHDGDPAKRMTREQLDVRSLNCAPPALLAAFCAWDGGQLATTSVLAEVTSIPYANRNFATCTNGTAGCTSTWFYGAKGRFPSLTQNATAMWCFNQESCPTAKPCPGSDGCSIANFSNDAGQLHWGPAVPYYYRPGNDDWAARIAAPGRMTADTLAYKAGDEPWMDVRGNLQELSLDDRTAGTYAFGGVHYDSVGRRNKGGGNQIQPEFKIAQAGGRCMRFRDE